MPWLATPSATVVNGRTACQVVSGPASKLSDAESDWPRNGEPSTSSGFALTPLTVNESNPMSSVRNCIFTLRPRVGSFKNSALVTAPTVMVFAPNNNWVALPY